MEKRFYYKSKDGHAWVSLKSPALERDENYERISEEEWNAHLEPKRRS